MGSFILISMWLKIFLFNERTKNQHMKCCTKNFWASTKKYSMKTSVLCFGMMLWTRVMYELWLTWPGLNMIVGNVTMNTYRLFFMAHTRGVLLHFWLLQRCPWNLVDCRTRCTIPIETRTIWALNAEQCVCLATEQEAKLKVCWPQYLIKNNWNSSLAGSTRLLRAVHPCVLVACTAAKFLHNGRRAANLCWCQGNVLWFWRIRGKLLVARGKTPHSFLLDQNQSENFEILTFADPFLPWATLLPQKLRSISTGLLSRLQNCTVFLCFSFD